MRTQISQLYETLKSYFSYSTSYQNDFIISGNLSLLFMTLLRLPWYFDNEE